MNDDLLRGIMSTADRDALMQLPSDPLADMRQALDTIAKASQVVIVHPAHRQAAEEAVASSAFPGLIEVVVTQHAPRDRVFLIPKPAAPEPDPEPVPTYGMCTACGSVEVALVRVTGTRDLSAIGEHEAYPTGHGCEVCS